MTDTKDAEILKGIREMDISRILLETDAPYFGVRGVRRTTPSHLGRTAVDVAKILGKSWKDVMAQCTKNTERLYIRGLPPDV